MRTPWQFFSDIQRIRDAASAAGRERRKNQIVGHAANVRKELEEQGLVLMVGWAVDDNLAIGHFITPDKRFFRVQVYELGSFTMTSV